MEEKSKSETFKNFMISLGWMSIILLIGFEIGFVCSKSMISVVSIVNFNNGSIPNNFTAGLDKLTLDKMPNASINPYCSTYQEPYWSCPKNLQFINRTGLYCNNTLVCQN